MEVNYCRTCGACTRWAIKTCEFDDCDVEGEDMDVKTVYCEKCDTKVPDAFWCKGSDCAYLKKTPEANKDDNEKLQYHLIPPEALEEVTKVLMFGAKKYGPGNWEKGMAYSRIFDAILRHLIKWFAGEDTDSESGLHHLSHVLCNVMFLVAYARRRTGTDDRQRVPELR